MKASIRNLLIVCGAAAVLLSAPAESKAIFHWLCPSWSGSRWCNWGSRQTTYAPPYTPAATGYARASGCTSQTCSYVPQTYYRPVMRRVPMTTYRPVTACDPCTGCPTTYCCPQTAWVNRVQMIPYTTYRAVWTNRCAPAVSYGGCSTCGPATSYSSTISGAATSSCPSCVPSTTVTTPAPTSQPSASTTPSLPNSGSATGGSAPQTFERRERPIESSTPNGDKAVEPSLQPVPETESRAAPLPKPRLIDPVGNGAKPAKPARLFHTASHQEPAKQPKVDFGGWRASRD